MGYNVRMNKVIRFFDRLEDRIRLGLSHRPISYAFVGGVGVVLFWKGVWETAELFPSLFGPVSIALGVVIMLLTGLFVSFFIGDSILISALKREKKIADKTEEEVLAEGNLMRHMHAMVDRMSKDLEELKKR